MSGVSQDALFPPQTPHFCLRMRRLTVSAAYPPPTSLSFPLLPSGLRLVSRSHARPRRGARRSPSRGADRRVAGLRSPGSRARFLSPCLPRWGLVRVRLDLGSRSGRLVTTSSVFRLCPPTGSAPGPPHPPSARRLTRTAWAGTAASAVGGRGTESFKAANLGKRRLETRAAQAISLPRLDGCTLGGAGLGGALVSAQRVRPWLC